MTFTEVLIAVVVVAAVLGLLLPSRWNPVASVRDVVPFLPRTSIDDAVAIGKGRCPVCGGDHLLAGPRGGIAQNIACDDCHSEFNVGYAPDHGIFMVTRMGKIVSAGRGRVYGMKPEEFAQ